MYYIIICYIIKLLLHYIYLYINYSNNLFNVPNLFLGRLDVLFTNFMMETKKAFNRLYYSDSWANFFNPFGIQWKKILVNNYIKTITVTLLSGKQFSYFIFWNEYLWNDLVMIFNTLDILIISLTKYAEESIPDKILLLNNWLEYCN